MTGTGTAPQQSPRLQIGPRAIGPGKPCLIIGEVAQAHEGSLGMAHAFIDAVAQAGADAVKFQTHIAEAESSAEEPFRVRFSTQDESRFDYWKRMEFSARQWKELAGHAREKGLLFLSSPFSREAVEVLLKAEVPAWKIASGELPNRALMDRLGETGLPLLLSTGMSSWTELDRVIEELRTLPQGFAIFQCTSAYPCPARQVGLNVLREMADRYHCPVGLSDHSGTIYPGLAAAALGASLLEVHVTFSRETFGPDVPVSLTIEEFRQLIRGVRFIEEVLANPVDKDALAAELEPLRRIFTRSLFAARDLPSGTVLEAVHLVPRKPGTGIPADRLGAMVGRRLGRELKKGEMLTPEHLQP